MWYVMEIQHEASLLTVKTCLLTSLLPWVFYMLTGIKTSFGPKPKEDLHRVHTYVMSTGHVSKQMILTDRIIFWAGFFCLVSFLASALIIICFVLSVKHLKTSSLALGQKTRSLFHDNPDCQQIRWWNYICVPVPPIYFCRICKKK